MADLTQLLLAASQADSAAEQSIKEYETRNFPEYVQGVAAVLAAEGKDLNVRQLAGLVIKNLLAAKDDVLQAEKHGRWKALDPAVRENVKNALLGSMRSPELRVPHIAAVAAAEVAAVELPYNEWPSFLPALLDNVTSPQFSDPVKIATLECLGYTCERVANLDGPEIHEQTTDSMLTAIVDGIQPSRPDKIRLAAATALKNSLIFSQKNMEKQEERSAIMNTICEATRSNDQAVRSMAYECIVQIAVLYYDKLQDYMTTLYELTTQTIRDDKEEVAKSAIEFWSSLAEVEQELLDEAADLAERGLPVERQCMRYVAAALTHLAPILMETLAKQEEDADEDTYNLHMAGHICLSLISQTVEDAVVPVVMPFVNQNIQNENWRLRDAAIMAFTSMLDGPSVKVIGPYVAQSIPVLLNLMSDPHVMVRDTSAHCISRICLLHVRCIPSEIFPSIMQALIAKCGEGSPKVASQACSGLHNLASAFTEEANQAQQQETNALSVYMPNLMQVLLQVCDRPDSDEANLRVGAMEAISVLVSNSASDVKPLLVQLIPQIVGRLEATFGMQDFGPSDREKKEQVQGLLCAVVQVLFQKLDKDAIMPFCDKIVELLLRVLQAKNATCHEECFSAIAAIADALDVEFTKYMPALQPFLIAGLRNFAAYQLCIVAVATVGDICRAIESQVQPFCDEIMHALLESLRDSNIHRSVKPPVLSCFGDIAMAIGAAYDPYLQYSVMMLMQAAQTRVPDDDDELIEYFNLLRESILEAYIGIVQGLRDGNMLNQFMQYVPSVMQFMQELSTDPNRDDFVLAKAVGLVGDIAQAMGPQVGAQLSQPFIQKLLQDGIASGDQSIMSMSTWANGVVIQTIQGS